jgi:GNAT superfamily N-acetyltransferase
MDIEEDEFVDAAGRRIRFENEGDIVAYDEAKEIGRIQFEDVELDHGQFFTRLVAIDVDAGYQKSGIGVELVRRAVIEHGPFCRPRLDALGGLNRDARDFYTAEGAALIRRCISLGILDQDSDD